VTAHTHAYAPMGAQESLQACTKGGPPPGLTCNGRVGLQECKSGVYRGVKHGTGACTTAMLEACGEDGDETHKHALLNHHLLVASREGDAVAMQMALVAGAYVETRRPFGLALDKDYDADEYRGLTPLMYAAQLGSVECCGLLLRAKADVHAREEDGLRPLHFAATAGAAEACVLLLEHRADPEACDSEGQRPIDLVPASELVTKSERRRWRELFTSVAGGASADPWKDTTVVPRAAARTTRSSASSRHEEFEVAVPASLGQGPAPTEAAAADDAEEAEWL